ncbi:FAD binding domain-containing protein [Pseudonocardia asaccharolytica]|uniref:Carbon monoxide dehydrogenase n=1 Tax=Pseudonocardia asaccharolytica DSM 44247 = NBRC 16224 TaxID=1123024 RepID=A0A511D4L7_9PSEU|nr:xanthine dehydrogenase family protein subunit M [Pseudonocardia asaccharolytica]GEL19739.1 carbon monoxide dehydrogenase [Pseudonocardia asaccharolytica DSM 44247 = NBRC 16224]
MKPAPLDYIRATSVAHAVQVLAENDGDGKVLAGGQSLVPLLAMRLSQPTVLVDLGGLGELSYIRDESGHVEIGAMVRARTVEISSLIADAVPLLPVALRHVGHVTIRNRGTVGGSTAHADPAAELPAVLRALDADVVVTGPSGSRTIGAADFFQGFLTTALAPDEIVTALRVPKSAPGTRVAVQEFARRHGDFAIVAVFAAVELGASGEIAAARIAVAGADQVPVRAAAAEELLAGQDPSPAVLRAAAAEVAGATRPFDDIHGTADYRKKITAVLARRCLEQALPTAERSSAA